MRHCPFVKELKLGIKMSSKHRKTNNLNIVTYSINLATKVKAVFSIDCHGRNCSL